MLFLLCAFTLFHCFAGVASLSTALRLLTPLERAHWRSQAALFVAELLFWVYPIAALASVRAAWRAFAAGAADAFPMILTPLWWLLIMGAIFAVVDYVEDGILGNARVP